MRSTLVVDHRMNFVDDHRLSSLQHFATAFGRKQDEERFGSSYQNVRRPLDHLLPFEHGGVAGSNSDADWRQQQTFFACEGGDLLKRTIEILLNIVAQRFQRGN